MEWLLSFMYAALLAFIIYRFKIFNDNEVKRYIFPLIFILKCIVGLNYSYFQLTSNKGTDMFWYMYETNYLFESCKQNPVLFFKYILGIEDDASRQFTGIITTWNKPDFLINDARTLLRFNLFIRLISCGSWQTHTIVFCFMSTIGFVYFAKFFAKVLKVNKTIIAIAVTLTPSILLWTSLILKESILVFLLGVFLWLLHNLMTEKTNIKIIAVTLVFFLLLFTVKSFVILLLIPLLISFYICLGKHSLRWILLRWSVVLTFFWLLLWVAGNISNEYSVPYRLYLQQQTSLKFAVFRGDKSYYQPPIIAPCWTSLLKRSPMAAYNVLTLPTLKSANSIEKTSAALENILVILSLIFSIYCLLKSTNKNYNIILLCFSFSIVYFALIGLTTVVEGALVRYKLIGLIFLIIIIISAIKKQFDLFNLFYR